MSTRFSVNKISIFQHKLEILQSQPNYQQNIGAQNDRCSNKVIEHKDIDGQKQLTTVTETDYQDHDMQTDTAFKHLEQIT